jgi:hypothetical protein
MYKMENNRFQKPNYLREQGGYLLRIGVGFEIEPGSLLRVYAGPGNG